MTQDDSHGHFGERLKRLLPARWRAGAVVPVVRLSGVIGAVTPLRPGMSLAGVSRTLEKAFATKGAKAVALVINSPGGSPVQSRQIYQRIRQLAAIRQEEDHPSYVAFRELRRAAYGSHPLALSRNGTAESVEGLTHETLVNLHRSLLTAGNTVLAVALPIFQKFSRSGRSSLKRLPVRAMSVRLTMSSEPLCGFLVRRQTPSPTSKPLASSSVIS